MQNRIRILEKKLNFILFFCEIDNNGKLIEGRELVATIDGIKIEIYPNEHPPPHFHVKSSDLNISVSILNGSILKGTVKKQIRKKINHFYKQNKSDLIEIWNQLRPSDCPVGKISI